MHNRELHIKENEGIGMGKDRWMVEIGIVGSNECPYRDNSCAFCMHPRSATSSCGRASCPIRKRDDLGGKRG